MATDTDTAVLTPIKLADLRWLTYAIRNVQTRTAAESAMRQAMIKQFDEAMEQNPRMEHPFVFGFTREQMDLLLWSANEGRCRGDERLIRDRMVELFEAKSCGEG